MSGYLLPPLPTQPEDSSSLKTPKCCAEMTISFLMWIPTPTYQLAKYNTQQALWQPKLKSHKKRHSQPDVLGSTLPNMTTVQLPSSAVMEQLAMEPGAPAARQTLLTICV